MGATDIRRFLTHRKGLYPLFSLWFNPPDFLIEKNIRMEKLGKEARKNLKEKFSLTIFVNMEGRGCYKEFSPSIL